MAELLFCVDIVSVAREMEKFQGLRVIQYVHGPGRYGRGHRQLCDDLERHMVSAIPCLVPQIPSARLQVVGCELDKKDKDAIDVLAMIQECPERWGWGTGPIFHVQVVKSRYSSTGCSYNRPFCAGEVPSRPAQPAACRCPARQLLWQGHSKGCPMEHTN